jgi:hypothetical protein
MMASKGRRAPVVSAVRPEGRQPRTSLPSSPRFSATDWMLACPPTRSAASSRLNRKKLNPVVVGAVGGVGNPRPHAVRDGCAPGGRGLSKRLWAARSAVQGDGGQVVGRAHVSAARPALPPPGAAHELATGAVSRGTVHSPRGGRGSYVRGVRPTFGCRSRPYARFAASPLSPGPRAARCSATSSAVNRAIVSASVNTASVLFCAL